MKKNLTSKSAIVIYALIVIALIVFGYLKYENKKILPATETKTFINDSSDSLSNTDDLTNDNDADNQSSETSNQNEIQDQSNNDQNQSSVINDQENTGDSAEVVDKDASSVSSSTNVSGKMFASITQQHCNDNCEAFASDLRFFEYCEQSCGISPIKEVKDCDDKKDLQKDYCFKDLAIGKKDASGCDKIKDTNIKQACKNRIAQDAIENMQ